MYLDNYFTDEQSLIHFTREQSSDFAKGIAGDFNPIHDVDNKRFCVPGDLMFAVLLHKEGLSQSMSFDFAGMVNEQTKLSVKHLCSANSQLVDSDDKVYLSMNAQGDVTQDQQRIEKVVRNYVAFSGMNFPHIMVPLMRDQGKMINLNRPLVMYKSMQVEFNTLDFSEPKVNLTGATMDVQGKRANITLCFEFMERGVTIGKGEKTLVASGLVDYDEQGMQQLVDKFNVLKAEYSNAA